MLDALRRGSTGMVAKLLFALLVLSFAIWGVADVFTGWGRGALAKVGGQDIRLEEYQRAFQNEINAISQQAGRRITTEQAHAAGLDNRVMARLIAWSAVEQHGDDFQAAMGAEGITVSHPEEVGDALRKATSSNRCTVLEVMLTQELGDPFRRDALKKPKRLLPKYADFTVE